MFYQLQRAQSAQVLEREFSTLEAAAEKIGIKLICRDLLQILNPMVVEDPQAKFFMKCFQQNRLPYQAYTADQTVSYFHIKN